MLLLLFHKGLFPLQTTLNGVAEAVRGGKGAIHEHSSLIGFENHHHLLFEGVVTHLGCGVEILKTK